MPHYALFDGRLSNYLRACVSNYSKGALFANKGEYETIHFCVDMPMLFESFVAEWLKANAPVNLLVGAQYVS